MNTELIKQLLEEKRFLLKRLDAINTLLISYKEKSKRNLDPNHPFNLAGTELKRIGINLKSAINFPLFGRKDKQVLWLFENWFAKGVKLIDVQNRYNELCGFDESGKEIRIDNVVRNLKRDGKLVVVKYNSSNKLSFWGHPSWVGEVDFLENRKPSEEFLPISTYTSEVVRK